VTYSAEMLEITQVVFTAAHWIGGSVDCRTGLATTVVKKTVLPCRELKPCGPANLLSELFRIIYCSSVYF